MRKCSLKPIKIIFSLFLSRSLISQIKKQKSFILAYFPLNNLQLVMNSSNLNKKYVN